MQITVRTGSSTGTTYALGPSHLLIGRDQACDIRLTDLQTSRRHACIHRVGTRFEIEDLQSAQGTVVNGRPVARHQLQIGDHIQLGDTKLAVIPHAPPVESKPLDVMRSSPHLLHELINPLSVVQLTHQSVLDHLESVTLGDTDRESLDELLAGMKSGIDHLRDLILANPHRPTVP